MTVKQLKDIIADLPDDMLVVYWVGDRSQWYVAWASESRADEVDIDGVLHTCFCIEGPC